MYIYKWIEGRNNLNDFCLKRFKTKPKFNGTIGHAEDATIHLIYKRKEDGSFTEMYLLFMKHKDGVICDINEVDRMTYEQIRTDKTAILK